MVTANLQRSHQRVVQTVPHNKTPQEAALEVLYPAEPATSAPSTLESAYQLAQKLISNLRKSTIDNDVLNLMTQEETRFEDVIQEEPVTTLRYEDYVLSIQQSMQSIVDQCFAVMEPYIDELNHKFGLGDMHVAFTQPQWVTEQFGPGQGRARKSFYRARVSTSRLSVVIRGAQEVVDFYVLPSTLVMGLSTIEDRYEPLMTFRVSANDGQGIEWEVEGKQLSTERLQRYCLLLLNYLLEETRSELNAARQRR